MNTFVGVDHEAELDTEVDGQPVKVRQYWSYMVCRSSPGDDPCSSILNNLESVNLFLWDVCEQ